jgi:hypothetical protein
VGRFQEGCPLPKVAVDEWGRSQTKTGKTFGNWTDRYHKVLGDYLRSIGNFMDQVGEVVILAARMMGDSSISERRELKEQFDRLSHVSHVNLAHAGESLQKLRLMMNESVLAGHFDTSNFRVLASEETGYRLTLCLWNETRQFLSDAIWPKRSQSRKPTKKKRRKGKPQPERPLYEKLHRRWLSRLADELTAASDETVYLSVLSDGVPFNGLPSLWVGIDIRSTEAATSDGPLQATTSCVTRAIGERLGGLKNLLQQQLWHKILFVPTFWGEVCLGESIRH